MLLKILVFTVKNNGGGLVILIVDLSTGSSPQEEGRRIKRLSLITKCQTNY